MLIISLQFFFSNSRHDPCILGKKSEHNYLLNNKIFRSHLGISEKRGSKF